MKLALFFLLVTNSSEELISELEDCCFYAGQACEPCGIDYSVPTLVPITDEEMDKLGSPDIL